jgi:hypothetical protein
MAVFPIGSAPQFVVGQDGMKFSMHASAQKTSAE